MRRDTQKALLNRSSVRVVITKPSQVMVLMLSHELERGARPKLGAGSSPEPFERTGVTPVVAWHPDLVFARNL
jgi:hypothetical protein